MMVAAKQKKVVGGTTQTVSVSTPICFFLNGELALKKLKKCVEAV